jgi:hypothetical protein
MTKLTALQEAMRIVEKYSPNLFQVYSQDSRNFLSEMKAYLEKEKQQIIDAYIDGEDDDTNRRVLSRAAEQYYNETYGGEVMSKQTAVEYLIEQLLPKALGGQQHYHIEIAKAMEKEQIVDASNTAIDYYKKTRR